MQERTMILDGEICEVVEDVIDILNRRLEVNFTFDEIINNALKSFVNKTSYISLFPSLTGKIKFTFDDAFRLDSLTEEEDEALEALKASIHRNPSWKPIVEQISMDMEEDIQSIHTENQVQILYDYLKEELETRKRGKVYRSGYKRLIIKSSMISIIRRNNVY